VKAHWKDKGGKKRKKGKKEKRNGKAAAVANKGL
jgi:hypothetical protein